MKMLNFDAYRFSISWSRIFPGQMTIYYQLCNSKKYIYIYIQQHVGLFFVKFQCTFITELILNNAEGTGKVNWKGVAYYNRLINYLLKRGNKLYCNRYQEMSNKVYTTTIFFFFIRNNYYNSQLMVNPNQYKINLWKTQLGFEPQTPYP